MLLRRLLLLVLQEKASRIDRIVSEHQLFSQGLKELQNWVADTSHMLHTYCSPTADKNVLDSRVIKLEVNSPLYLTFKSKHKYIVNLLHM